MKVVTRLSALVFAPFFTLLLMSSATLSVTSLAVASNQSPTSANSSPSTSAPTREDAIALVRSVIASIKEKGRDPTFAMVNDANGAFYKAREMNLAIGTMAGKGVANAANPRAVGRTTQNLKDADGKLFIRIRNEALQTQSAVWTDFSLRNVAMQRNEPMAMYAERYEDLVISAVIDRK